jgi:hypothetical protein
MEVCEMRKHFVTALMVTTLVFVVPEPWAILLQHNKYAPITWRETLRPRPSPMGIGGQMAGLSLPTIPH